MNRDELSALLRLLDDDTPEVQFTVQERLLSYGGDLSEILPELPVALGSKERELLSNVLHVSRRSTLEEEWQVPGFGLAALEDDWEQFEAIMRMLSDYLHDGITLRLSLSDGLDLLAEEARGEGVSTEDGLRAFLFESGRLVGNQEDFGDPRNSDLAWCLAEGRSNPVGLGIIFVLIAQRLELAVDGVDHPRHFLCRYSEGDELHLVDCFHGGTVFSFPNTASRVLLSAEQRTFVDPGASPSAILMRVLTNLSRSFRNRCRIDDFRLMESLQKSLVDRTVF